MSSRELPARPNIEYLKKQARSLLHECLAADETATARFAAFGIVPSKAKLADALHVIAREYGFDTWPSLKLHIEAQSEDPLRAFTAAIKANNAPLVRAVLAHHAALKSHLDKPLPDFAFDQPAIMVAVQKENRELIDVLLEAGANINARTQWWAGGFGVLDSCSPHFAEYLISRGAALDIHSAGRLGKVEQVREFLSRDPALVHARGGDGQLPLHFAASVEIAALLLDHGADINARDIDHESTAAQYLVCAKTPGEPDNYRHEVVRFLIARGAETDILMASALGGLALVERILNHDPETVRVTVSERSFPKRNPESGGCIYLYGFGLSKTPHMLAREFGHAAVFDLLMQRSPAWLRLIHAAEMGDEALVDHTLQQHPSLFARLSANAARRIVGVTVRNNTRAVELLLDCGWPAQAVLDNGQTALHYAAWHGNTAMVRALLARQAAVNVFETEHGGSPLAWALHGSLHSWERGRGDYAAVARELLAAGAAIPKPGRPLEGSEEVLDVIRQHLP